MIPLVIWSAPSTVKLGPAPHRVLLALWDFAHRWTEGAGSWFVFPSVERIAAKLGIKARAIYANLRELAGLGLIERETAGNRTGWRLHLRPMLRVVEPAPADVDGNQLALTFPEAPIDLADAPAPELAPEPIARPDNATVHGCALASSTGTEIEPPRGGDSADAVWSDYERDRCAALGGTRRTGAAPASLHRLWQQLGATPEAWGKIREYGRRAIAAAVAARVRPLRIAPQLERWRADGREWARERFDAVMSGTVAPSLPAAPRARTAPAPAPARVQGQIVIGDEADVFEAGGAAAVLDLRSRVLDCDRMADMARGFLRGHG